MKPALLVIDVQKGIDEERHWGGNRNNPEAEGNIKLLLAEWRANGFPVFIIQHISTSEVSPFFPGKPGQTLKDFITVAPGETLIRKSTANAFINTELKDKLELQRASEVVITGFVTNNSVEATARMCGESGFKTLVVSDATACFSKVGLDGVVYSAELVHQISLSNLHGEYADILTTKQTIDRIRNNSNKA